MTKPRDIGPTELERREFQLSLFASSAIVVLAAGLALLMYPAVFSSREASASRTPQIAFFGFCGLSCLLAAYIVERQITIRRLRRQMASDRKQASEALEQASADLLATMPNFATFEDRLAMEFRRAAAAELKLSVLVLAITVRETRSGPTTGGSALGDAAKAISRKLRGEDSIYNLRPGFFGVILPGADQTIARRVVTRLSEGLSEAAGVNEHFSFQVHSTSYPEQASTAHDLELAVCGWLPEEDFKQTSAREVQLKR